AIERLKRYGVKTVELGCQSMCDEVLTLSNRGHTSGDVRRAAGLLRDGGFEMILQMMTGLPGDTRERSLYTAGELIKLMPDGVRIYPTVIVRDTRLYDMWRCGQYKEHTVEDAVALCAELVEMFRQADIPVIRLGLNPSEELSGGGAAGGAYHPAFGELVYSRIYLNRVRRMLEGETLPEELNIWVYKGRTSVMTGQKRCNIDSLRRDSGCKSVHIAENAENDGEIVLPDIEK
ncbi:MAG: radical SAM protein, partial [Oscillospiraceae bacterium]|nr:radical SAM protein [Oscillospiraceae bacterium]